MTIDHIAVIADNDEAFTAAVSAPGALRQKVPSCPDWTVADLVYHLAEVQAYWTLVLRAGGERPDHEEAAAAGEAGDDLLGFWRRCRDGLLAALRSTDPDAPTWCWWAADRRTTARDVTWRQAHEVLVHRWDAELAIGEPRPVDPALAADGVDEFVARYVDDAPWAATEGGLVGLRATDVRGEWKFLCEPSGVQRSRAAHSRPDVVVAGTAEQLDLLLWRRVSLADLAVSGDRALAMAFLAAPDLS
ncbi:MAG TPA: maleylpyruvate isomerase family mycothiol-dependent enzyme [Pseudonocardiaceae bacterium]